MIDIPVDLWYNIKKGEGKERLIVYLKYNLSPPQRS